MLYCAWLFTITLLRVSIAAIRVWLSVCRMKLHGVAWFYNYDTCRLEHGPQRAVYDQVWCDSAELLYTLATPT